MSATSPPWRYRPWSSWRCRPRCFAGSDTRQLIRPIRCLKPRIKNLMRRRPSACFVFICLLLVLACASVPAFAQPAAGRSGGNGTEPTVPEKVGKELHAFYVGESAPRIDGRLDDEA